MLDTYPNFAALASGESPNAYSVILRNSNSRVLVAAPHGGGIEVGTSEIAVAIAGNDLSYYRFEGNKADGNKSLHITSSNFDEPQGIALMRAASLVLTVHGEKSDAEVVYLGGRNTAAIDFVRASLVQQGFTVRKHRDPTLQGLDPQNICNIGSGGAGVQLELTHGLRATLFESLSKMGRRRPTPRLSNFVAAIRCALLNNVFWSVPQTDMSRSLRQ